MSTIVLKGVPVELRKRLEERARASGRSLSGEVIACLEEAVGRLPKANTRKKGLIEEIRDLRDEIAATTDVWITNEEIDRAKRKGRP